MKYTMPKLILSFLILFLSISLPVAQAKDSAMIVFDASGSMWGQLNGKAKIEIARDVMGTLVKDWNEDIEMGLMAYGHREKGNCDDIEILQAVTTVDSNNILNIIQKITPKGKTPISQSLKKAAETLRYTEDAATVILISDGEETCNADPCVVSKELEEKGINFTTHVIGFDVKKNKTALKQLKCIAENTGGQFFQAEDAPSLKKALIKVKKAVVDPRPTQCKTYAENAVKQEQTNIEKECSFKGEFWTTEYATHFDWCMAQAIGSGLPDEKSGEHASELKKCEADKTNHTKKTSEGTSGKLVFNWSGKDKWMLYRGDTKVHHYRGKAEQTLQAGTYTIKAHRAVFEPFDIEIKGGETNTIDLHRGKLVFNWSGKDKWMLYRGDTKVHHYRGKAEQTLQTGTYTIKAHRAVFEPFDIEIKEGETLTINK